MTAAGRPCPPLKPHPTGLAYCTWSRAGKRLYRYFGPWGSHKADRAYRRFARQWATAAGVPLAGSVYNRRGVGHGGSRRPPPADPTDAPPGSEAKVAVLAERAAAGVLLWHPRDATIDAT